VSAPVSFVCFGNDSAAGFVVSCFSCRNLPTQFFAVSAFVMLHQVITLDVEVVHMRTVLKYLVGSCADAIF
jgi:hypothetical protein